MTAARRLPTAKAAPGAHHNHISAFPARTLSPAAGPASRSFVQPGAPPLTPAPPPACLETSRDREKKGHITPLDTARSFRDDLHLLVAGAGFDEPATSGVMSQI